MVDLTELPQLHWLGDVLQLVGTERPCFDACGDPHCGGEENLAAVACRLDSCSHVDDRSEVVAASFLGLTEMEAHPHAEFGARPRGTGESELCGLGREHGVARPGERGGERVAGRVEDVPAVPLNSVAHQLVVELQARRHRRGIGGPQPRRPLDIGEQERHRPAWSLSRHAGIVAPAG